MLENFSITTHFGEGFDNGNSVNDVVFIADVVDTIKKLDVENPNADYSFYYRYNTCRGYLVCGIHKRKDYYEFEIRSAGRTLKYNTSEELIKTLVESFVSHKSTAYGKVVDFANEYWGEDNEYFKFVKNLKFEMEVAGIDTMFTITLEPCNALILRGKKREAYIGREDGYTHQRLFQEKIKDLFVEGYLNLRSPEDKSGA